jgi:hypothetical protein
MGQPTPTQGKAYMAKIKLQAHSDFNKDIKPLETALEGIIDALGGYFGYIYGDPDLNEKNYLAVLWATNQLSGLVSKMRPVYEFGYSEEQDAKLSDLMENSPYKPYNPYKK